MEHANNSEKTTHDYKQAHVSLVEIWKKARKPIRNANIVHQESLTGLDKFALWITKYVGTMGFFFIIFIWTVISSPGIPLPLLFCALTHIQLLYYGSLSPI
jgi:hypothetical protein